MSRILTLVLSLFALAATAQKSPVDYVNPFVGTTNFGTTNPGAVCPNGLMSATPFNVMGSDLNKYDKDKRWWACPYTAENVYLTGFSHVNLSGVGCPDLSALLLMPTTGDSLNVNYEQYGSVMSHEVAQPGYYSCQLDKYGIRTEVTATPRTALHRFTFPKGRSHVLMNLGEALSNETGGMLRRVSDNEVEGVRLLGTFCYYNQQGVFPLYFVMRVEKQGMQQGYWKFQRPMVGDEADWDPTQGTRKVYKEYAKEIAGDDVGAWFSFDTTEGEQVLVRIGVSFVSIENARLNLETEQQSKSFDQIHREARQQWNDVLSRIEVEGGTEEQKGVLYTGLYHLLIHPNILQDVNGEYPMMESDKIGKTDHNRYTVFSLWDTYRCTHQLITLLYPDRQEDMLRSMMGIYREFGWLPRWELYGRETRTMEGDPALPVIVDSYLKGLCPYDAEEVYQAMRKHAFTSGKDNPLRPDNDDYMQRTYVPLRSKYDNSVCHSLEYYVADYALAQMAERLGHKEDAKALRNRAQGYKKFYSTETRTLRPITPDGKFLSPFNPLQGENFEACPGFHEGTAWNYSFAVPYDVPGMVKLWGGKQRFVQCLQDVFDKGYYDPTNEPNIGYPYIFSQIKGEEWRTQRLTRDLLAKHFSTKTNGLPGNDDTGTMSAWAIFAMIGIYPDTPGLPVYTFTAPVFDKVTIHLDPKYYPQSKLVINAPGAANQNAYIQRITVGGKAHSSYRISHDELMKGGVVNMTLK